MEDGVKQGINDINNSQSGKKVSWYNQRMKIIYLTIMLSIMVLASEWTLVKAKNGVSVYTAEVEGSDFLAYRGETVVNASIASVVAVLYDTPNCTSWLHECSFGLTLEELSFEENYIYESYDLSFPVSDRGLILRSSLVWEDKKAVLSVHDANDYCDKSTNPRCVKVKRLGLTAIPRSKGAYTLTRLDANKTSIVWQAHTNPGGSIPTWMVNMLVVDMPYYSLLNLRTVAKEDQYKEMTKEKLQKSWQEQYDKHH